MLLSSRAVVLWVLLKLWLYAWPCPKQRIILLWTTISVGDVAHSLPGTASHEVAQHVGCLCCKQACQLLEFQDMLQHFNLILFAIMWQILEIGKARVSLLHDFCLSSKWEFKIKGNSTSIWKFLYNCCFSQMVYEISSGIKIFHAA